MEKVQETIKLEAQVSRISDEMIFPSASPTSTNETTTQGEKGSCLKHPMRKSGQRGRKSLWER